jgi:hypothetical protein
MILGIRNPLSNRLEGYHRLYQNGLLTAATIWKNNLSARTKSRNWSLKFDSIEIGYLRILLMTVNVVIDAVQVISARYAATNLARGLYFG